ncbi:MAG: hypothetical protein M3033_15100 [Acidobacteriota bacterium]|nr:hypothetical protein [Acidobacteriota bacterium]
MTISDLLVIYFSIGAPCGVYVYFQVRGKSAPKKLWLKALFTFFFWMPTAVRFLLHNKSIRTVFYSETEDENLPSFEREQKLYSIQKHLENFLLESNLKISIYEFREMLQRYIGLTFAAQGETEKQTETNLEFFYASQNKNPEIAARCFQRRNRERLLFHQTLARQDFLRFVAEASAFIADKENSVRLIVEFVKILEDGEAQIAIEKILAECSQRKNHCAVNYLEKDLWKPQKRKPSPANSISTLLLPPTQPATINLSKKD